MAYDYQRFKRLKATESTKDAPPNPYVKKIKTPADYEKLENNGDNQDKTLSRTSLLDGQNKHLYAQLMQAEREIKDLKQDIASLYLIISGGEAQKLSPQEGREIYMEFKNDEKHIANLLNRE